LGEEKFQILLRVLGGRALDKSPQLCDEQITLLLDRRRKCEDSNEDSCPREVLKQLLEASLPMIRQMREDGRPIKFLERFLESLYAVYGQVRNLLVSSSVSRCPMISPPCMIRSASYRETGWRSTVRALPLHQSKRLDDALSVAQTTTDHTAVWFTTEKSAGIPGSHNRVGAEKSDAGAYMRSNSDNARRILDCWASLNLSQRESRTHGYRGQSLARAARTGR
jgi:hypothetical protein